jgi:short-subunit dehydrogenase
MMARPIAIITGASSGIGEATAYELAQKGMDLVLAARRKSELQRVAEHCEAYGIEALVVAADVTDEDDVDRIAQAAVDRFGSFDVWVNNAAVTAVGTFIDMPTDMFRRVIETNLYGSVSGARVALRQFKEQGRGTLITVVSGYGMLPAPYESPYIASKFALRGFMASLRQETKLEGYKQVHICTVLPSTIDTPIYRNAANFSGKAIRPIPPIYPAEKVAQTIAGLIEQPRSEIVVGGSVRMMTLLRLLLPRGVFEYLFALYVKHAHFGRHKAPMGPGNLFHPGEATGVSGKWPAVMPPARKAAAGVLILSGIALVAYAAASHHKRSER